MLSKDTLADLIKTNLQAMPQDGSGSMDELAHAIADAVVEHIQAAATVTVAAVTVGTGTAVGTVS